MNEKKYVCAYCAQKKDGEPADNLPYLVDFPFMKVFNAKVSLLAFIKYRSLYVRADLGNFDGGQAVNINFCPICGRRLRERLVNQKLIEVKE